MINEAKTRKLFSLILQYYILYKDASYTRDIYYKAYEIECEREIKIKNRHIPSMTMSKKAFKRTITTKLFDASAALPAVVGTAIIGSGVLRLSLCPASETTSAYFGFV